MINKHKQKGAETVEFAMIALLFFAMLFTIIEFSRAMFIWNALTEATRRGARMAVICPVVIPVPDNSPIKQVAMFGDKAGSLTASPIIPDLTAAMVTVSYYLDDGVTVSADPTLIKFAGVQITGYTHTLIIPLWGSTITAPEFKTALPTESLGAVPTYPPAAAAATNCLF